MSIQKKKSYIQVPETLAPQNQQAFPVTEQRFIRGGHHQFDSISERDNFPMQRRKGRMTCTVQGISYILTQDLKRWEPFDRGYLVLNPRKTRESFFVIFPFHFEVISITSKGVALHQGLQTGSPNQVQEIIVSGSPGSVITYELARIYVDILS